MNSMGVCLAVICKQLMCFALVLRCYVKVWRDSRRGQLDYNPGQPQDTQSKNACHDSNGTEMERAGQETTRHPDNALHGKLPACHRLWDCFKRAHVKCERRCRHNDPNEPSAEMPMSNELH